MALWVTGLKAQPSATARPSPNARLETFQAFLLKELRRETIWWWPLRLFIAVGWLRAFAEKAVSSEWHDGSKLSAFLETHFATAVFPGYAQLMHHSFLPNAALWAWTVMIGQLLVGLSLLLGWYGRVGLMAGLFMNFNFVAAGEPNPSAFYLAMQMALLAAGGGRVMSVDSLLRHLRQRRTPRAKGSRLQWLSFCSQLAWTVVLLVTGAYSLTRVQDFTAAGSVKDPAAILAVLSFVGAAYVLLSTLRWLFGKAPATPSPAEAV